MSAAREAVCPRSFAASTAAAVSTSSRSTSISLTRAPFLERLRLVLEARPITAPEALVIFDGGRVGRFAHACRSCVGGDALIIPIAGSSLVGAAASGPGSSAGPGPSS